MGTNCTPILVDLFLFYYGKDFMVSLSGVKEIEVTESFDSTCRYLDYLLNTDNTNLDGVVYQIYLL